eukprot:GAHX01001518.1.p1 GENE.GAHX01001518.1~~GAHX01001518.1.p1  ORF type:complete len:396 (-),score=46.82 GAHX01001518.1:180-1367(-)
METLIQEHINRYPKEISHYNRGKEPKEVYYLSSDLTLTDMFRDYNVKHPDLETMFWIYRKVFYKKFDLKFKIPKTDLCDKCSHYIQPSKTNDLNTAAESKGYKIHLENSKAFYKLLKQENKEDTLVCSFDMMQTNQVPFTRVNSAFYKRQLSLHKEGLVITHKDRTTNIAYIWNEYQAKRDSNEISSILYNEFKNYNNSEVKHIKLFSDACPGQNRNVTIFSMLFFLAKRTKIRFSLTFPERGHSFIPPDRLFGRIEQAKKKKESMILQSDYESLYEELADVKCLGRDWNVCDWKALSLKQLSRNKEFKISKIRRIEFSFNSIYYSYSYDGKMNIIKILQGRDELDVKDLTELPTKSNVSIEKQKDIECLLQILGVESNTDVKTFYRMKKYNLTT